MRVMFPKPLTEPAVPVDPAPPSRTLRLLVADDEDLILRAVERLFEKRGHTVHCASCTDDALALASDHRFDAVLVDQNMPGSGLTLLSALMESHEFEGLAILMSGGLDSGENLELPGHVHRLQKPFRFAEVVPMVERHFEG